MHDGFAGSCSKFVKLFSPLLAIAFIPASVFLQESPKKVSADSSQTEWNQPFGIMHPSPAQLIQLRALQNPFRLHSEMTYGDDVSRSHEFTDFSQMFHSWDNAHLSYPGMEYRHGSNYIPQNVRDYTEFKMGRDRYLPVVNPVLIGFILYNVTQYASYYFGDKDTQSLFEKLNSQQKQMLLVLQQHYPLNQEAWYSLYQSTFPDSSLSKKRFFNEIKELDELSVVKTRTFEESEVRYYPAIGGQKDSER